MKVVGVNGVNKEIGKRAEFLENFLKDRGINLDKDFDAEQINKEAGITSGYVLKRENQMFMVKPNAEEPSMADDLLIRELVAGSLFRRLLYDMAPVIGLNIETVQNSEPLYAVRSKFLTDFQTLDSISEYEKSTDTKSQDDKYKMEGFLGSDIEGFEKVFMASMFLGDRDLNSGNLGVKIIDGQKKVAKIDHGLAFDMANLPENLIRGMSVDLYKFVLSYKNFDFNLEKVSEAVKEITKLSEDEVKQLIGRQIDELKKAKFDFDRFELQYYGLKGSSDHSKINPAEFLENYFITYVTKQIATFKDLANTLDVIKLIAPVEPDWSKRKWLLDIKDKDPIVWSIENSKTIAGKDPLD